MEIKPGSGGWQAIGNLEELGSRLIEGLDQLVATAEDPSLGGTAGKVTDAVRELMSQFATIKAQVDAAAAQQNETIRAVEAGRVAASLSTSDPNPAYKGGSSGRISPAGRI